MAAKPANTQDHRLTVMGTTRNAWDANPNWSGGSYSAVHRKLKRTYGPAKQHACTDCGGPAAYDITIRTVWRVLSR